jgi:hypothetical protein
VSGNDAPHSNLFPGQITPLYLLPVLILILILTLIPTPPPKPPLTLTLVLLLLLLYQSNYTTKWQSRPL